MLRKVKIYYSVVLVFQVASLAVIVSPGFGNGLTVCIRASWVGFNFPSIIKFYFDNKPEGY